MPIAINITDNERGDFMRELIASFRADVANLDDFERGFTASFQNSSRPSLWFTPKRRLVADRMWMKWGGILNHPFPTDRVDGGSPSTTGGSPVPPAKDGCCQYLVRGEDGRQHPCNEPAVLRRGNGFRYCDQHAELVRSELKKMRKTIHLETITHGAHGVTRPTV